MADRADSLRAPFYGSGSLPDESAGRHSVSDVNAEFAMRSLGRELDRVKVIIREVRDEMLSDGYHRPNALILKLDEALGEEHE